MVTFYTFLLVLTHFRWHAQFASPETSQNELLVHVFAMLVNVSMQ